MADLRAHGVAGSVARGVASCDVVVVGAGPAGAATAIALARRGLTTAIVERSEQPRARVGETLPPDVRVPLETLGVWNEFAGDGHAPAVGNRSYWGGDAAGDLPFVSSPYGRGWHIDRRHFEQRLIEAAEARGVIVQRGRQVHAASGNGPGRPVRMLEALQARFVVDASGRAAAIARMCGVERVSIDQLVGATVFLEQRGTAQQKAADPHGLLTVIEATTDGWWYSAPLPGGRLVAACMTDGDIAARLALRGTDGWLAQAQRTRATRERIGLYDSAGLPQISSANTSRLASVVGPNWLAVGDAAVSFDPLSSQGIVTALECGIDAADTIAAHLSGDRDALAGYAGRITARYRTYLVERAQYYGVERRWPAAPFWQRRQGHEEVLRHASAS